MKFYKYDPLQLYRNELQEKFLTVLDCGQFIGGREVATFEREFGNYTNTVEVVACGNGLDALKLAILDLNLPKQSKIGVSGHTFFATWLAILDCGHIPIGIDANLENLQMDVSKLQECLEVNPDISAVIYVHMHGILGPIEEVAKYCHDREIYLIEDCAQAHGLRAGQHVGTFGDFGAFSFYPTKNLPALGDAGAIISKKRELKKIRSMANYGWTTDSKEVHEIVGFNSRLDSLQAGFLNVHLKYLDQLNLKRSKIASQYLESLQLSNSIRCVEAKVSVWHHFPVLVSDREKFVNFLNSRNIPHQIHYPVPCHLQPAYLKFNFSSKGAQNLQNAYSISQQILSLPIHPWMSDQEVNFVQNALLEWIQKYE